MGTSSPRAELKINSSFTGSLPEAFNSEDLGFPPPRILYPWVYLVLS